MTRRALGTVLAISLIGSAFASPAARGAQTHWEAYRDWDRAASEDRRVEDPILVGAIDLHAHHGPDAYPRQWNAFQVSELAAERGLRAIVLKNHWTETAGLAHLVDANGADGIEVFGGVALNTPVGGMNPQAIRYMVDVTGNRGRVVWMPTHDSEHEVRFNGDDRPFVPVSRQGALLPETREVIGLIAEHGLTLATGHVTPDEAFLIMREARQRGVERIIVTHPMLHPQYTYMSVDELRQAAELGGYIEITAGTLLGGDEARRRILAVLREVGPGRCFVSSDSGLTGTPNHPDALAMAAGVLREAGFKERDLDMLFRDNPAFLLGLPIE